jgi:parallel beta-helix repeat protein
LHLEECDISSRTGACVCVHGGADARLRRNVIHDAWEVGVLFYQGGGGILEDSQITGCRLDGVEVRDGSDPVLRRNVIRDGRRAGVFIHGDGRGTLEENQITGNQESGVRLSGGGRPALRQNRITGNGSYGIYVHEGGGSLDEGNDLSGNRQGERGHEEHKTSRSVLPRYIQHGSYTGWNPGVVAAYLDF